MRVENDNFQVSDSKALPSSHLGTGFSEDEFYIVPEPKSSVFENAPLLWW